MSWEDILKADNVDFMGENEMAAWYDPNTKQTNLNLTKITGLEDLLDSDFHETIHQFTYDDIAAEIKKVVDEETKFLINRPDLYRVEGGFVQPKRQLFNEVIERNSRIASHIAFTEIVTFVQTRTKLNLESVARDEKGEEDEAELYQYYSDHKDFIKYKKQFADEMRTAYAPMWINIMRGGLNALGLDPNVDSPGKNFRQHLSERGSKRHRTLRDDFFQSMGSHALYILKDIISKNEPKFEETLDYVKQPESYADAKERIKRFKEESPEDRAKRIKDKVAGRKMKKSWEGVLKNIQISGQKTSSRDYVLPEKDDEECCELLVKLVDSATQYEDNHLLGNGMIGVPTFLDTSGYVPDDDFLEMIFEWKDDITGKQEFFNDIMAQLNKKDNPVQEWERLKGLWKEAGKYGLSHHAPCKEIVVVLDKWSDRNFVGWQFYEEWVHTYLTDEPEKAKERTQREYDDYMDSYRKIWMALLQNNCADILIPNDFMNYGLMKK